MKEIKIYRCEVDLYRNGKIFRDEHNRLYSRQTGGVYFVGAKTADEVRNILQKAIGFGSITVPKYQPYQLDPEAAKEDFPTGLQYKQIVCGLQLPVKCSTNLAYTDQNFEEDTELEKD